MIRWHVIFHERLYAEHYNELSLDDMKKHIRFVGVNELYAKTIPESLPREIIVYEKDFPGYNPLLQMNRYYESSVMFHLFRHPELLQGVDFVGFCQYDMNFPKTSMDQIKAIRNYDTTLVCQSESNPNLIFSNPYTIQDWEKVVAHFNSSHATNFTLQDLGRFPMVLYHSYGMSKKNFLTMMKWIESVQPLMLSLLKFDKKHLCGTIERFYGVYITFHTVMGTFQNRIVLQGMDHINEKKYQDPVKSYWEEPVEKEKKKLRILLVGHGNMSIPPNGWGAVESIIYEYYIHLTNMGHVVEILNDRDIKKIIEHIHSYTYDFIHFHNDILINIVDKLPAGCKMVFTSHYPYIHDPTKWNDLKTGYNYEELIMKPLIHHSKTNTNIHICAVSEKDYKAFVSYGIPSSSISISLNGVNSERFKIASHDVKHETKTVCLAQIVKRKRQNLFKGLPNVVCVGALNDESILPSKEQYLGSWSDKEKYENLTHYGNAILLSDGENGTPLSIKESLIAGLGVVVSEAVAFELPADWIWVHVIPESKLTDVPFLQTTCEMNRIITKSLRGIIRQKAKELWDWSILVPRYLTNVVEFFRLG